MSIAEAQFNHLNNQDCWIWDFEKRNILRSEYRVYGAISLVSDVISSETTSLALLSKSMAVEVFDESGISS